MNCHFAATPPTCVELPWASCDGGYLFLLADVAFAYACNTRGATTVAQAAQVSFLRPAAAGDELVAEAVERSRFGANGIYDVTVRRADGKVIAEFRGQSRSLPK